MGTSPFAPTGETVIDMCRNTSPSRITVLFLGTHTRTRFRLLYGVCTGTSQASKINPSAGYNMWCSVTRTLATIALQSRGFGCCTPKTTSFPRHHLRDPPPSQVRLPPVIRPCPPAKRTYCSRVLSSTPFAELCGATVAVVARSLAPEAPPHRTLHCPGSTI